MSGCSSMGKKVYRRFLALLLGMVFYALGLGYAQRARDRLGLTQVVLDAPISAAAARTIAQREAEGDSPLTFCFWGEGEKVTLTCPITTVSQQAAVTCVSGNPTLMDCPGLLWQSGCYLDQGTAEVLFRSTEGGQMVEVAGREMPVLGTVSGTQTVMVRLAEEGDTLSRCVLDASKEQAEGFLIRHGLRGQAWDWAVFEALMENLLLLPPCVLLLALAKRLRLGWRTLTLSQILAGRQLPLLGRSLLSLVLTLGGLWLLGHQALIPAGMLPSRWSDFSFWGRWWEGQTENFFGLLSQTPSLGQLQMTGNVIKSMGSAMLSGILAAWAFRDSGRRQTHADTAD